MFPQKSVSVANTSKCHDKITLDHLPKIPRILAIQQAVQLAVGETLGCLPHMKCHGIKQKRERQVKFHIIEDIHLISQSFK